MIDGAPASGEAASTGEAASLMAMGPPSTPVPPSLCLEASAGTDASGVGAPPSVDESEPHAVRPTITSQNGANTSVTFIADMGAW